MDYKIKKLPGSEAEIDVTVSFVDFEPFTKKAAILISEKNDIEGFRRGKAPYEVIKSMFGEIAIYERAADLAVRKTYPQVLQEITTDHRPQTTALTPIGQPEVTVTKLAPGNDLQYKVKLAHLPEIKLPDYKKIAKDVLREKKEIEVSDEEVKRTLEWIRESRAPLVTVTRPAQKGDRVETDFELRTEGIKIDGGDSRHHPLILGQGKFLPGFEDELVGMQAGEEKKFSLSVPEDWRDKNLAGKKLEVKAQLNLVQERQIPELTDEFAKSLGSFSSVEALKSNLRNGLRQEKETQERQRLRNEIIAQIAKEVKTELPEVLIQKEEEKMLLELKSGIEGMGMKFADYLLHIKKSEDDLKKDWRGEAENRVKQAFCLLKIAGLEKIEPAPEEVEARANEILKQYRNVKDAKEKVDMEGLKEYVGSILRNEKVFEFLEKV